MVEDEGLPAVEIAAQLEEAGFEVLGPVASVRAAFRSLEENSGCDAAVLDVNLGPETSEPIARALQRSKTPFIAISGYSKEQLPPIFAGVPFIPKPVDHDAVVRELERISGPAGHIRPAGSLRPAQSSNQPPKP